MAILVAGTGANAVDVTALTYGGVALTKIEDSVPNASPFCYTAIWWADSVPAGNQVVKITKASTPAVRVTTATINAGSAISVDQFKLANSLASAAPAIPTMTASGTNRLAVGIANTAQANGPSSRNGTALAGEDEGATYWDAQYTELPTGGTKNFTWAYAESVQYSSMGAMFSAPAVVTGSALPLKPLSKADPLLVT
ncbi:MAG: hypothetical protein JST59_23705 [Actinobacteria bacterium]|nr:hypothetical protein [Actinomycetota bacterium]